MMQVYCRNGSYKKNRGSNKGGAQASGERRKGKIVRGKNLESSEAVFMPAEGRGPELGGTKDVLRA